MYLKHKQSAGYKEGGTLYISGRRKGLRPKPTGNLQGNLWGNKGWASPNTSMFWEKSSTIRWPTWLQRGGSPAPVTYKVGSLNGRNNLRSLLLQLSAQQTRRVRRRHIIAMRTKVSTIAVVPRHTLPSVEDGIIKRIVIIGNCYNQKGRLNRLVIFGNLTERGLVGSGSTSFWKHRLSVHSRKPQAKNSTGCKVHILTVGKSL